MVTTSENLLRGIQGTLKWSFSSIREHCICIDIARRIYQFRVWNSHRGTLEIFWCFPEASKSLFWFRFVAHHKLVKLKIWNNITGSSAPCSNQNNNMAAAASFEALLSQTKLGFGFNIITLIINNSILIIYVIAAGKKNYICLCLHLEIKKSCEN